MEGDRFYVDHEVVPCGIQLFAAGYRLEFLGVQLRNALGREPLPGGSADAPLR